MSEPKQVAPDKQYDISATVTIDEQGYARVIFHSFLGHTPGDSIPLWSVNEGKVIGEIKIGTGLVFNGHGII